jgi:voltage-gated potassium channel
MKRIAVFGYSIMSMTVMARLRDDHYHLLFLGQNEEETELMHQRGYLAKTIDFRNDEELKAIGIGSDIDVIFCFFPADSDNVFLTISARALAENLTIITVVDDPESADKLLAAGANKIIDPHEICGRKAHEMLTRQDVSTILDNTVFGDHDLNIAQIEMSPQSNLLGHAITDLQLGAKYNLILLGAVDQGFNKKLHLAIGEQTRLLTAGDVLVVLGSQNNIRAFKEYCG